MSNTQHSDEFGLQLSTKTSSILRTQVLDATHITSFGPVYAIAPYPKRVNFASQQTRAFNLVWALTEAGIVGTESNIAVVGAGLAGLTAASALRRRGVPVRIFEASDEAMKIQRYTTSRFVHPTLNYWPNVALNPIADFPCLYWSADNCNTVIETIRSQWEDEFGDNLIDFNSRVTLLDQADKQVKLHLLDGRITAPFDAIILAVGFGLEEGPKGAFLPSYWENDDPRRKTSSDAFYVSGIGDGGLLEGLRLVYKNFGEGQLTSKLARLARRQDLEPAIKAIEQQATAKAAGYSGSISTFLAAQYQMIPMEDALGSVFESSLDGPGKVKILARGPHAFSQESAPIHRLMLARAIQARKVEVLSNTTLTVDQKGNISIGGEKFKHDQANIIVRHGPAGEIGKLLAKDILEDLETKQKVLSGYQYDRLWPRLYFDLIQTPLPEGAEQAMLETKLDHLLPSLVKEFGGVQFEVGEHEGGLCFRARLRANGVTEAGDLPIEIFGRPLIATVGRWKAYAGVSNEGFSRKALRPLRAGDKISTQHRLEIPHSVGVLGGFVKAHNSSTTYALGAKHLLGHPRTRVYAESQEDSSWRLIGQVSESYSAVDDVALVELDDGIEFEVAEEAPSAVSEDSALIGKLVTTRTKTGTVVRGRITAIALDAEIETLQGSETLQRAVVVRSEHDGIPFAQAGGSGTLVAFENGIALGMVVAGDGDEVLVSPIRETIRNMDGHFWAPGRYRSEKAARRPTGLSMISDAHPLDWLSNDATRRLIEGMLEPSYREHEDLARFRGDNSLMQRALFYVSVAKTSSFHPRYDLNFEPDFIIRDSSSSVLQIIELKGSFHTNWKTSLKSWSKFVLAKELLHLSIENSSRVNTIREIERAARGAPVSFEAALRTLFLSLISTEDKVDRTSDVVVGDATIRPVIEPAIYEVSELKQATADRRIVKSELSNEVARNLGRNWLSIIDEMARGHLVTLETAMTVERLLKSMGRSTDGVRAAGPEKLHKVRAAYSERLVRRVSQF